jgi:hypothetical protein
VRICISRRASQSSSGTLPPSIDLPAYGWCGRFTTGGNNAAWQPRRSHKSNSEPFGVIRSSDTLTSKPDEATRARLKAAGFKFENGNWSKNQTEGKLATLEDVALLTPTG